MRLPKNGTYSISENSGYFRLYAKPGVITLRHLPPIDTTAWKKAAIVEHIVKVRWDARQQGVEAPVLAGVHDHNGPHW